MTDSTPYSTSIAKALRNLGWHSMADHVLGMQAMIDAAPTEGDRVRVECPRCDATGIAVDRGTGFEVQQGTPLAVIPAFTAGLLWAWLFPVSAP